MKEYDSHEIEIIIKDIEKQIEVVEKNIEELRAKRSKLGLLDLKGKKIIDEEIHSSSKLISCYHHATIMFMIYEDSLSLTSSGLSDEEIIRLEQEAENGNGFSKFMVFCHRCFIDKNITKRDITRLEIELDKGDYTNEYILWCYKTFFEDTCQ